MGRKTLDLDKYKEQIENADKDQLQDDYTSILQANFGKIQTLNSQLTELGEKLDSFCSKADDVVNSSLTTVRSIEETVRNPLTKQTKEMVQNAAKEYVLTLLKVINTENDELIRNLEATGDKIISKMNKERNKIAISQDIFMGMIASIVAMLCGIICIVFLNVKVLHSDDINYILLALLGYFVLCITSIIFVRRR